MQDLEFPFLTSRIVSDLTGLSERTLRQWAERGILAAAGGHRTRRSPRKPVAPRLYSWREVERLQWATHLLKSKRLPIDEVRRLLERSQSAAFDRDWVIARRVSARPRPKVPRQRRAGARGYGGSQPFSRTPTRRMR